MMSRVVFLNLLFCLFASGHASRLVTKEAPEYGVGFHLALDYATTAILYANGTAIHAAKVEGDELYKRVIRRAIWDKELAASLAEMSVSTFQPIVTEDYNVTAECNMTEAVLLILKLLKLETEKHISTSLIEVYITISSPMDDPPLAAIHSACRSLGLDPIRLSIPAWQSALRGYNVTSNCPSYKTWPEPAAEPDDLEQLLLVIEYTRAGMIAILATEECGSSMEQREMRNSTLGSGGSWEGKFQNLEDTIREITRPPSSTGSSLWLTGPGGEDIKTRNDIAEVVLIGESADHEDLSKALENVFGEHWQVLKQRHDERAARVDPIFVSGRGAAIRAFEDLEWLVMDECDFRPC